MYGTSSSASTRPPARRTGHRTTKGPTGDAPFSWSASAPSSWTPWRGPSPTAASWCWRSPTTSGTGVWRGGGAPGLSARGAPGHLPAGRRLRRHRDRTAPVLADRGGGTGPGVRGAGRRGDRGELGLPGATSRAAAVLRDKLLLREATGRAGMPTPRWREIRGPEDIVAFAQAGPVVVKPADRQASGRRPAARPLAIPPRPNGPGRRCWRRPEPGHAPDRPLDRRFLAEERVYGTEYSVEALVREGSVEFFNVTEKSVIGGRHPVESGHVLPAPVSAGDRAGHADRDAPARRGDRVRVRDPARGVDH
ncbi:hypothetical protein LT493_43870 [Streptomyces tricolor]|nr:hypothetical protein [Streptomyces tricolor]